MKLLNSTANGIIHAIWIQLVYIIEKKIAKCVYDVLQTLSKFNFSDWQIMYTTLSLWCWANVGQIYNTHRINVIKCWAGLLVTLGKRWPMSHTLGQSWFNVGPMLWENSQCIGPKLAQHFGTILGRWTKLHWANVIDHLPTLGQCNWLHWSNVGQTLACYLGTC